MIYGVAISKPHQGAMLRAQQAKFNARFIALPRELRELVYNFVHDTPCDITITRQEVGVPLPRSQKRVVPKRTFNFERNWLEETILYELAQAYCQRTAFIVLDVRDLEKALELDVFGIGSPAFDFVRHIQVDIRTHCFDSEGNGNRTPDSTLENTARMLGFLHRMQGLEDLQLTIRIRTYKARIYASVIGLRTMDAIWSVVQGFQLRACNVTVYHLSVPWIHSPGFALEDVTSNFECSYPEWTVTKKSFITYSQQIHRKPQASS
ncbi:hypothetical protein EJ04DRAFT_512501 [Polyplosphaeria fusca]|uniref:Uncharacterized protein n=1 Tax=Polyplosphaeria fusca TaxID=682080 RepID=A0A9P4R0C6_9PLEO|nr:hypothetical protein EJ04DRAFT_512501 [Polyplosphaeria fusca]